MIFVVSVGPDRCIQGVLLLDCCSIDLLRINGEERTSIEGLFSAGKSAGGAFGSSRANNGILNCLVFGNEAGIGAARYAISSERRQIDVEQIKCEVERLRRIFQYQGELDPSTLQEKIHETAWTYVGIVRDGPDIRAALVALEQTRKLIEAETSVDSVEDQSIDREPSNFSNSERKSSDHYRVGTYLGES